MRTSSLVLLLVSSLAVGDGQAAPELKSCVETVCGNAKSLPNAELDLERYSKNTKGSFEKVLQAEFMPLIKRWIENEYHIHEITNTFFSTFSGIDQLRLTTNEINLINFLRLVDLYKHADSFDDLGIFGYRLKEDKYAKADVETRQELKDAEKVLNSQSFRKHARTAGLPAWARYAIEYPTLDFNSALNMDLATLGEILKILTKRFPELRNLLLNNQTYNSVRSSRVLDQNTSENYFSFRMAMNLLFEVLTSDTFKEAREREVNIQALARKHNSFERIRDDAKKFLNPRNKKVEIADTIKLCEESIRSAYYASPTAQEVAGFKNAIEKLKSHSTELIPQISDMSHKDAASKVKEIGFHIPLERNDVARSIMEFLRKNLNDSLAVQVQLTPLDITNSTIHAQLVMGLARDRSEKKEEETALDNVKGFCKELKPTAHPSDFALLAKNLISTSWYSLRYKEAGLTIAAHEMGHAVMNSANIKESITQCLLAHHQEDTESKYLKEDFADAFASRVLYMMEKSNDNKWTKKNNFNCGFLGNTASAEYTTNLSLKNPDNTDPHSSYFFRALHIENYFSYLPKSCKSAIQREDKKLAFRWCL